MVEAERVGARVAVGTVVEMVAAVTVLRGGHMTV